MVDHFVLSIGNGKFLDGRGEIDEHDAIHPLDQEMGIRSKPMGNGLYENHLVEATPAMIDEKRPVTLSPPGAADTLANYILERASTLTKSNLKG
jgi:hypothetical protein